MAASATNPRYRASDKLIPDPLEFGIVMDQMVPQATGRSKPVTPNMIDRRLSPLRAVPTGLSRRLASSRGCRVWGRILTDPLRSKTASASGAPSARNREASRCGRSNALSSSVMRGANELGAMIPRYSARFLRFPSSLSTPQDRNSSAPWINERQSLKYYFIGRGSGVTDRSAPGSTLERTQRMTAFTQPQGPQALARDSVNSSGSASVRRQAEVLEARVERRGRPRPR